MLHLVSLCLVYLLVEVGGASVINSGDRSRKVIYTNLNLTTCIYNHICLSKKYLFISFADIIIWGGYLSTWIGLFIFTSIHFFIQILTFKLSEYKYIITYVLIFMDLFRK